MEQAKPQLPDVIYCNSAYEAAEGAEAVVIATEWEQFRALDLDRLRLIMARPVIVDLRNIYPAEEMKRANFRYLTVGRPAAEQRSELRCRDAAKRRTPNLPVKNSPRRVNSRQRRLTAALPQSRQFYLIAKIYFAKFERHCRVVCRQGYGLRRVEANL